MEPLYNYDIVMRIFENYLDKRTLRRTCYPVCKLWSLCCRSILWHNLNSRMLNTLYEAYESLEDRQLLLQHTQLASFNGRTLDQSEYYQRFCLELELTRVKVLHLLDWKIICSPTNGNCAMMPKVSRSLQYLSITLLPDDDDDDLSKMVALSGWINSLQGIERLRIGPINPNAIPVLLQGKEAFYQDGLQIELDSSIQQVTSHHQMKIQEALLQLLGTRKATRIALCLDEIQMHRLGFSRERKFTDVFFLDTLDDIYWFLRRAIPPQLPIQTLMLSLGEHCRYQLQYCPFLKKGVPDLYLEILFPISPGDLSSLLRDFLGSDELRDLHLTLAEGINRMETSHEPIPIPRVEKLSLCVSDGSSLITNSLGTLQPLLEIFPGLVDLNLDLPDSTGLDGLSTVAYLQRSSLRHLRNVSIARDWNDESSESSEKK